MLGNRLGRIGWLASILATLPACSLIVGFDDPVPLELESLTIAPGGLDQAFDPTKHEYTASPSYVDTLKITPRSSDPDVMIKVTSSVFPDLPMQFGPNNTAHDIPMVSGDAKLTIEVQTPQGISTTYTVDVTVPGARFGAPSKIPQSGNAVSVKTADLDGDGTPDVAVCSNNGVFLFDGMTGAPLGSLVPAPAPCLDLAIDDINKATNANGRDLVVVTNSSDVKVFLNQGAGEFAAAASVGGGSQYMSATLGDLDGDGNPDLVLGDREGSGRMRWSLGNGAGAFGAVLTVNGATGLPVSVVLGELDDAQGVDVMDLDGTGSALALVQGDGDGVLTFDEATDSSPTPTTEADARSLVRVEADAVMTPDYALVHGTLDELAVIRNFAGSDTDGSKLDHVVFPTETSPTSVVAADLDGDGNEDLIVTCRNAVPGKVMVFYGDGAGGFQPISFDSPSPIGVAVTDFNGDTLLDLAVLSQTSTEGVHILLQETP